MPPHHIATPQGLTLSTTYVLRLLEATLITLGNMFMPLFLNLITLNIIECFPILKVNNLSHTILARILLLCILDSCIMNSFLVYFCNWKYIATFLAPIILISKWYHFFHKMIFALFFLSYPPFWQLQFYFLLLLTL